MKSAADIVMLALYRGRHVEPVSPELELIVYRERLSPALYTVLMRNPGGGWATGWTGMAAPNAEAHIATLIGGHEALLRAWEAAKNDVWPPTIGRTT